MIKFLSVFTTETQVCIILILVLVLVALCLIAGYKVGWMRAVEFMDGAVSRSMDKAFAEELNKIK